MMTTTSSGVADTEINTSLGLDGTAEAFLSRFLPEGDEDASKKKPSDDTGKASKEAESTDDENDDTPEASDDDRPEDDGDDEGSDAETDEKPKAKKYVDDDETFTRIKVDDKDIEVPVKDLKRLFGQEAALTRKSQEVAEQRKAVETEQQKYAASLDVLMMRATERANQYRQFNFLALAKDPNISAEELTALQSEAQRALEEERFVRGELGNFVTAVQQQQQKQLAETAQHTVKALSDPKSPLHIEGWNEKLYGDLRSFAVGEGIDAHTVNNIVEAPVIKLLHMAMMYKRGATKVTTVKADKTPKKIVKTSSSPTPQSDNKASKAKKALKALQSKGTIDNAANAFMSRWDSGDND